MKKQSKINEPILRQIQKWLRNLKHKQHFDMDILIDQNECGTSCCIAGKTLLIHGYKYKWMPGGSGGYIKPDGTVLRKNPLKEAREILGLSKKEGERLFLDYNWPDKFRFNENTPAESYVIYNEPRVEARRIEHFINTGGKE